jgi:RNA-directed DNA polymerase
VRSRRAGERVLQSVKKFLEKRLKLKVNEIKSGCAPVEERQFLGYRLLSDGKLVIATHSKERLKDKIRLLTRRNRGVSIVRVISELNEKLRGWGNCFQLTQLPSDLESLDSWIRRKLRCYRLKQCTEKKTITKFLMTLGVSKSIPAHHGMNKTWFDKQGLISMTRQKALLNV